MDQHSISVLFTLLMKIKIMLKHSLDFWLNSTIQWIYFKFANKNCVNISILSNISRKLLKTAILFSFTLTSEIHMHNLAITEASIPEHYCNLLKYYCFLIFPLQTILHKTTRRIWSCPNHVQTIILIHLKDKFQTFYPEIQEILWYGSNIHF